MNLITISLLILLFVTEYFSFFYVIFRQKPRVHSGKWILCVALLFVCGSFPALDKIWLEVCVFAIVFVSMYGLFDNSLKETGKLFFVAFPTLSILETIGDCLLKNYFDMEGTERTILYLLGIVIGLWIYYAVLGRRLSREAFQMQGKIRLIFPLLCF